MDRRKPAYSRARYQAPEDCPETQDELGLRAIFQKSQLVFRRLATARTLFAFVCLLAAMPVSARPEGDHAPAVVVILSPELSSREVLDALADPRWTKLRSQTTVALSSAAVPGPDSAASGFATLWSGRRVPASEQPSSEMPADLPLFQAIRNAGLMATSTTVRAREIRPSGNSEAPVTPEGIAAHLAPRPGVSVVMTPQSWGVDGSLKLMEGAARKLDGEKDLLVLTSPNPDPPGTGEFRNLAPMLFWGKDWHLGTAVSSTTRTPGLVSNTDLAPTILQALNIPIPRTMEGHAAKFAPGSLRDLSAFERHVYATGSATIPVLFGWSSYAFLFVGWILWMLRGALGPRQVFQGRVLLGAVVAAPLAMLLAGLVLAPSAYRLAATVGAFAAVLTLVSAAIASRFERRISPLLCVLAGLVAVIVVDLAFGGRLLARCLLGDFVNTGVRFYGIGNEYEGLVLGASTLLPFIAQSLSKPGAKVFQREGWLYAACVWPLTLVAVAAPGLGADFGGAVSLAIAYGAGAWLGAGRRLNWRQLLPGVLLILLVTVAAVALDLLRPPGMRSHIGELAAQVLEGGGARLWEVIGRKAAMNVRMATTPYSLAGMAAVAVLGGICYHLLAERVRRVVSAHPLLRAGSLAALSGAAVALVLNDSGIVAGGLAAGCVLMLWLDAMLAGQLDETVEKRRAAIG